VSVKQRWSPQELALAALTILLMAALLYLALSNMSMGIPRKLALELGLCYACVSGSGLAVEGAHLSKYGVYAGGGLASACPSAACRLLSAPLDRPAAEVAVVANSASAALRLARLPGGAYALEAPHGLAQAPCQGLKHFT